jgi:hypothetical protein
MSFYAFRKMFFSEKNYLFKYSDSQNPIVFLNVAKDGKSLGKMVFEVKAIL